MRKDKLARSRLDASKSGLAKALGTIIAVLVTLHVLVMVVHYEIEDIHWLIRDLFDLDEEQSFGTWFSTMQLLTCGVLLLWYARALKAAGGQWVAQWKWLGLGFCFLSLDEMVGLHESVNTAIDISWAIPGGVVVILVGLLYTPFLLRLERQAARWFVASGALYVGGAIVVEFLTEPFAEAKELSTLAYNLTTALEEGMEMAGVAMFICSFIGYIKRQHKSGVVLQIGFKNNN